jgi:hypothetical protein
LINQHAQDSRCISVCKRCELILSPHSEDHLHGWPIEALGNLARGEASDLKLTVQLADADAVAADAELKESLDDCVDVERLIHGP